MNPFSNSFEKKWTFIFLFMYVLIMLPFPWYYATEYIPSFWELRYSSLDGFFMV